MDPDERRQLILDAARRAFATQSYEEVSLSTIAREAKASEALVHKYFSTKGRLYGRVLALDAEDLAERTRLAASALADSCRSAGVRARLRSTRCALCSGAPTTRAPPSRCGGIWASSTPSAWSGPHEVAPRATDPH